MSATDDPFERRLPPLFAEEAKKPAGRVRNQALDLIGQLDGVARAGGSPHLPRIRSLTR
jgi:hypothetical protein